MKSKSTKLIILGLLIIGVLGWAGWQLFKPKAENSFSQTEISIKQADIPDVNTVSYEDWSGFRFSYPDILTVKEVELDNPGIYSSLEISGTDGKKLTIRVADTQIANLIDWQKTFNQQNSVRKIDQTTLADLPALKLQYGAPEMMLTVAIDSGIIYQIESLADDGFWNRTHADLVASFQFTNVEGPASAEAMAGKPSQGDAITLIEETIE